MRCRVHGPMGDNCQDAPKKMPRILTKIQIAGLGTSTSFWFFAPGHPCFSRRGPGVKCSASLMNPDPWPKGLPNQGKLTKRQQNALRVIGWKNQRPSIGPVFTSEVERALITTERHVLGP